MRRVVWRLLIMLLDEEITKNLQKSVIRRNLCKDKKTKV